MKVQWLELKAEDAGVLTASPSLLELPESCTVEQALRQIGFEAKQVEQLLSERAVAVYGHYALAGTVLFEGDRVEILDRLNFDPMESRRRRAQHKMVSKRQKELAKYARRSQKQSKTPA